VIDKSGCSGGQCLAEVSSRGVHAILPKGVQGRGDSVLSE
jgi:hypothetical protein